MYRFTTKCQRTRNNIIHDTHTTQHIHVYPTNSRFLYIYIYISSPSFLAVLKPSYPVIKPADILLIPVGWLVKICPSCMPGDGGLQDVQGLPWMLCSWTADFGNVYTPGINHGNPYTAWNIEIGAWWNQKLTENAHFHGNMFDLNRVVCSFEQARFESSEGI